ncbi:MAG: polysulfide reductase NrfD [Polyangiaceae bacterium]|jgi:Ni/Fe-hydrogenase subunit HybB-like protein|nr:polysulfide reductase NrfD [Polyangiaceae bacterium]
MSRSPSSAPPESSTSSGPPPPSTRGGHQPDAPSYFLFLWRAFRTAFDGRWPYYAWMTLLTICALIGANAWAHQVADGLVRTGMSDHVSWGFYIANFTFSVGLAAGAVMMVIPAYLYDDHEMHDVVIIGEMLAIAAIVWCLGFVIVDMGRPDRLWHMLPGLGRFNFPRSMLTWDMIVLNGYLLLNLHITGYLLYMRFLGRRPAKRWYVPFVFVSIGWAVSVHAVTAFLYAGLGGRPFWNSALLAPRFIVTAFVAGPAFIIVLLEVLRRVSSYRIGLGPTRTLHQIMKVTVAANLFMFASEVFTSLYAGGAHASAVQYLLFGLHGKSGLVPWMWTAIVMNVASIIILLLPRSHQDGRLLAFACVLAFIGVWIEKGMGLIVPGFVPSTLHELVEYTPSWTEWRVSLGVAAAGLIVLTVALKIALAVLTGRVTIEGYVPSIRPPAPAREVAAE